MKQDYFARSGLFATVVFTLLFALTGCGAVSPAVKGLIDEQAKVTDQTLKSADKFVQAAQVKTALINDGLKVLDESMQAVQAEEAKYALVFSSNQNVETKSGVDATAAAYMVAEIYLADQAGLSATVKTQFADSEAALLDLAKEWRASWEDIKKAQEILRQYANGTAVAAVDANFAAAVADEIPGARKRLDALLPRMKALKSALDQASNEGLADVKGLRQARTVTGELVDLLDSIGKSKSAK